MHFKRGPSLGRDGDKTDNEGSLSPKPQKKKSKPGPKAAELRWTRVIKFKPD